MCCTDLIIISFSARTPRVPLSARQSLIAREPDLMLRELHRAVAPPGGDEASEGAGEWRHRADF